MSNEGERRNWPWPGAQNPITVDFRGWRDRFVLAVLRLASIAGIVFILAELPTASSRLLAILITTYLVLLAITFLPAAFSVRAAFLFAIVYAVGLSILLGSGPYRDGSLYLLATVAMAGLLFDTRVDLGVLGLGLATLLTLTLLSRFDLLRPLVRGTPLPVQSDWLVYDISFALIGTGIVVAVQLSKSAFERALGQSQRTFQQLESEISRLQERVRERTESLDTKSAQLRSTSLIARDVAQIHDVPDLLDSLVHSVAEQFSYYHVGLYLLDAEKKNAFLQAASSILGKQLVGEGFRADPDRRNPIVVAAEEQRAYVVNDSGGGAFIRDTNFPQTRSRMVLPLGVRGEVLGVLDMHSEESRQFDAEDTEGIQTLANLVALTIDNVRLSNETKTLLLQLEAFSAVQTGEIWTKFTRRHAPAYQYTPAGVRPLFSSIPLEPVQGNLLIPLVLHGETIGNIKLRRRGSGQSWAARERELIQKIADQVALALENSRLVDEAQKNAQRDQLIANISSRVRETLDVESVIRTASSELRKVFDLKEAEISIGAPRAEPWRSRKNTGSLR